MRILCLTARLPYPPNRGDRLRAYNHIRSFSSKHEIHLVSFIGDEAEIKNLELLKKYCKDVRVIRKSPLQSAFSVGLNIWRDQPLQALYYRSRAMQNLVDRKLAETRFDIAYIHLFRMAPYFTRHSQLYRIVDLTDIISREVARSLPYRKRLSRIIYSVEQPRIHRYERLIANTVEETWLISETEKRILATDCPNANIQAIHMGVDAEQFYPTGNKPDPATIVFFGHMNVPHNIDAAILLAKVIFPQIVKIIPECKLIIIGAEPAAEVLQLAQEPAVTVTGFLPSLNEALNQATIMVAPLRFSAGIQYKILEAMATARPVVTTSNVNEGLEAKPGKELIIADDPNAIAIKAINLLRDANLRDQIGQAGRDFVNRKFSWDQALERITQIQQGFTR